MNRDPINPDDPLLTAYALGELPQREMADFETLLECSPQARRELAERREIMSFLYEGFEREWHGQCNPGEAIFSKMADQSAGEERVRAEDSPLTRYALGELGGEEAAELERRLHCEPSVRTELEETREVMALLREGLKNEWKEQLEGPFEPASAESVIVPVDFAATAAEERETSVQPAARRARRKNAMGLAAAAAAALFLGVGALFVDGDSATVPGSSSGGWGMADVGDMGNSLDRPEGVEQAPRIILAEEVADLEALTGEGGSSLFDGRNFPVDASYLQGGKLIQASYREGSAAPGLPGETGPGWIRVQRERVDSYFPTSLDQDFQSGHFRGDHPSGLRFSGKSV